MAKKTAKKKWSFKRIKRIFRNVLKEISDGCKSLHKKFMELPKHIKTIMFVWIGVVALILLIIIATAGNNKQLEEYANLENLLVDSTLKYLNNSNEKIYPVMESRLKLDINVLKEFANLNTKELDEKSCKGFTLTYYDDDKEEYVIRPYISCDKYTTKEYKDYK